MWSILAKTAINSWFCEHLEMPETEVMEWEYAWAINPLGLISRSRPPAHVASICCSAVRFSELSIHLLFGRSGFDSQLGPRFFCWRQGMFCQSPTELLLRLCKPGMKWVQVRKLSKFDLYSCRARLLIYQCSQVAFVCMYVCMYIYKD